MKYSKEELQEVINNITESTIYFGIYTTGEIYVGYSLPDNNDLEGLLNFFKLYNEKKNFTKDIKNIIEKSIANIDLQDILNKNTKKS